MYRRLAAGNPAAYEPDLASSLNNLSIRLADAGRRDEGLTAIQTPSRCTGGWPPPTPPPTKPTSRRR